MAQYCHASAEASPQRRQAAPLPSRLTGRPWRKPSAASARFPGFGLESGLESGPVSGGWVQVPISRDLLPIPGFGARFSRPVSNGPFLRFSQAGAGAEHTAEEFIAAVRRAPSSAPGATQVSYVELKCCSEHTLRLLSRLCNVCARSSVPCSSWCRTFGWIER